MLLVVASSLTSETLSAPAAVFGELKQQQKQHLNDFMSLLSLDLKLRQQRQGSEL